MTDDLKKKVTEWFSKQGYHLEMRVANEFETREFGVALGEFYDDPIQAKRRELDVVAVKRKHSDAGTSKTSS